MKRGEECRSDCSGLHVQLKSSLSHILSMYTYFCAAASAYPHPIEAKYVLKGAATTESQLVFMAATAGK